MIELESRLADLGDALDVGGGDELVTTVVTRLAGSTDPATANLATGPAQGTRQRPARSRAVWLRVAAVIVIVAAALAAIPSSRQAIADWFGLDGVVIDRKPELSVPAEAPPLDEHQPIGNGTVVEVDGTDVLVSEIDGRLDEGSILKSLGEDTGIERVEVSGNPGLWIEGEPHVVSYRTGDDEIVSQRFAGNTLLWQAGDVIHRVEGFATLDEALAFATTVG